MDQEALLSAAPLMSGKIKDQRGEIRENMVLSIIDDEFSDSEFEADDLRRRIKSRMEVKFETGSITRILEDHSGIIRSNDEMYKVSGSLNLKGYDRLIDNIWLEFSSELSDQDPGLEPHILDQNVKQAFTEFFDDLFRSIYETNESIRNLNQDPIYEYETERVIDKVIERYELSRPIIFKESLQEYLNSPSRELKKFTGAVYRGLINWDLLNREDEVDLDDLYIGDRTIFFDTNVLVALLCQTDNRYPIVSELVEHSQERGFDLYYLPETRVELNGLIRGSKSEMEETFGSRPPNTQAIESQFVEDWYRKRKTTSWSEYKAEMSNWDRFLEMYDIHEYPDVIDEDSSLFSMVESSMAMLDESEDSDSNNYAHDAHLITKAASLRSESDEGRPSPIVITLHNLVSSLNEIGKSEYWEDDMIVQAREWLNYLLSFSTVSYSDDEAEDLGSIVLRTTINLNDETEIDSLERYSELLAPKAHLEQSDSDMLEEYITTIGLKEEVEKSLERGRGGEAERTVRDALESEEYQELFRERSEKDDKLKQASETVDEFEERYKRERARRKEAEKLFADVSGTEVVVNTTAISESMSASKAQSISNDLNNFIELLDSNLNGGISGSDVPEPPEEFSNIDKIKTWLDDTATWLGAAQDISSGAQALQPVAQEIASSLPI